MRASFWTDLLDFIAPRTCAICGRRLSSREECICISCICDIPFASYHLHPLDNPMARLFWGLFPVEKVAALFFYQPRTQPYHLIHDLKYHYAPEIGQYLGRLMVKRMQPHGFFDDIDAIIPMPITWLRRIHRGYNQSEEIAKGIHELTGIPIYNNVVKRHKFKHSQTKLSIRQRRENVRDAFHLNKSEKVRGKHVLLIDDVITTGSTITACAEELTKAGDIRISVLSIGLTK